MLHNHLYLFNTLCPLWAPIQSDVGAGNICSLGVDWKAATFSTSCVGLTFFHTLFPHALNAHESLNNRFLRINPVCTLVNC